MSRPASLTRYEVRKSFPGGIGIGHRKRALRLFLSIYTTMLCRSKGSSEDGSSKATLLWPGGGYPPESANDTIPGSLPVPGGLFWWDGQGHGA